MRRAGKGARPGHERSGQGAVCIIGHVVRPVTRSGCGHLGAAASMPRRAQRDERQPFLGTDLQPGPNPDPNITGTRTYTRAHFLHYAGVVKPGIYR